MTKENHIETLAAPLVDLREQLQDCRQKHGKTLARIAREARVDYQRVWRYAGFGRDLEIEEMQRLRSVLTDGGVAVDANPSPNSKGEQAPAHRGVSNDAA